MTGELIYFYYEDNRIALIETLIDAPSPNIGGLKVVPQGEDMSRAEHATAVKKVKGDIVEGKIFQCEVGFKYRFDMLGESINLYEQLRIINPSPQMYYIKFAEQKIIGASPELLFRLRQGEMETYPLAGTTKRGATPEEDTALARALLNDPKEIAEHNMIVDLHRNDIGRVARFGTVKVRSLMDIKRFSHVQHISSEIVGIMAENEDMFSALASNFPAGTLTGAPKIEAMKIIDELELDGRGPYGGAVGHFGFNGDCTFAIPIRTIFANGSKAYVQTCRRRNRRVRLLCWASSCSRFVYSCDLSLTVWHHSPAMFSAPWFYSGSGLEAHQHLPPLTPALTSAGAATRRRQVVTWFKQFGTWDACRVSYVSNVDLARVTPER